MPDLVPVKISAASARQPFNGCDPAFIRDVCHAKCCDAPTRPTGMLVTIHPSEQHRVETRGGVVKDGLLQPKPEARGCPFKNDDHLCDLHFTPDKPFGCIASPFTLNKNNTLIVRNRYRLMPCYKAGKRIPAYRAFRASLMLIFGVEGAKKITAHLDGGGGDLVVSIPARIHAMLTENDAIKKRAVA